MKNLIKMRQIFTIILSNICFGAFDESKDRVYGFDYKKAAA